MAIRLFNEGHKAAPDSAVPLLNLGLAEAQLPGHELRAICWLEAYLATVPDAANAPAVRKQIASLKLKVSSVQVEGDRFYCQFPTREQRHEEVANVSDGRISQICFTLLCSRASKFSTNMETMALIVKTSRMLRSIAAPER